MNCSSPLAADPSDYSLKGPEDFVRLDGLCFDLLGRFFRWLQTEEGGGLSPRAASDLAHAADRYLRDFVVDIKQTGPTDADPTLPRQYLANWYIIHTLEPSHAEIDGILAALGQLYPYLALEGLLTPEAAGAAAAALDSAAFFHGRLEAFWTLTSEEVEPWRAVDDYRGSRASA